MDNSQNQPFLEAERQNTDNSLNAERDKTNESLDDARKKTERTTDKAVIAERLLSDQRTPGLDSDQIMEQERTRVDAALVKERQSKDALVVRLLEQEREKTDENLLAERSKTDAEVDEHTTLLSAEIAEHLKTKTRLTSRDEFLSIVSHDLKNPIGAASMCAEMLLQEEAYSGMDPEVRNWIQFIKRNVDTSLRLIGDLLDMERVAEGRLQVKFARHDIGKIIRESIANHRVVASAKKISIDLIPSDVSGEIICDRDRIFQVVTNLVGNAVKFTPEGGSIRIEACFTDSELNVSVSDDGPGIPKEKHEKIFERFVQLTSADRNGLGLGLHISKMVIEAHQGRLWVESKFGAGSTFFFALPRTQTVSALS